MDAIRAFFVNAVEVISGAASAVYDWFCDYGLTSAFALYFMAVAVVLGGTVIESVPLVILGVILTLASAVMGVATGLVLVYTVLQDTYQRRNRKAFQVL